MVKLSNERIEQILHEETLKTEEPLTVLRSIYSRYMRLYEDYLADIDALDDDKVAEFRDYHEETMSLVKNYYMDIPLDVCSGIEKFDTEYGDKLLGPEWHKNLFDLYEEFKRQSKVSGQSEEYYKAEFTKQALNTFYDSMDYVFRPGFGTGSETVQKVISGVTGLLFGK